MTSGSDTSRRACVRTSSPFGGCRSFKQKKREPQIRLPFQTCTQVPGPRLEDDAPAQQNLPAARIGGVLSEARAAHIHYRIQKVPVIEDVKELAAELQCNPLL